MTRYLLPLYIVAVTSPSLTAADSAGADFFEKQVRPLLAEHCLKCHGDNKPKGGLRLTSRQALLKGGDSGPAVVASQPDKSLLVQAVRYLDATRMPPRGKLQPKEIEILERWVRMGAPWPDSKEKPTTPGAKFAITQEQRNFWSFQSVLPVVPPAVKTPDRVITPIDRFILQKLEANRLSFTSPASRRTLIRRVTFDLTGLPPTPDEVDAFVNDGSPDAYERLVDRLLSSPAHGERWGRHWLDLVRYTDSFDARGIGGEMDCADAWRYRDWVVRALNADMGYDRFVRHQIAGDLIPGDGPQKFNRDGIIATGMLAIGNWGGGDADKEKLLTDIADDQVDVVSRTFLGLTVSCARCHDHKFDPISTGDYYGLAGIFFSSHILPNVGPKTNGPPMLRIPLLSPAEMARQKQNAVRIVALTKQLDAARARAALEQARQMLPHTPRYLLAAHDVMHPLSGKNAPRPEDVAKRENLHLQYLNNWLRVLKRDDLRPLARTVTRAGGIEGVLAYRNEADCPNAVINTTAQSLKILTFTLPPRSVSLHPGPKSAAVAAWTSPISGTVRITGKVSDADSACGDGVAWRLVSRSQGELASGEVGNGGSQTLPARQLESIRVAVGERIELVILPRREYSCDTTTVQLTIHAGDRGKWDLASDVLADPLRKNASAWSFFDTQSLTPAPGIDLSAWNAAVALTKDGKADRKYLQKVAEQLTRTLRRLDASNPFYSTRPEDETLLPAEHRAALNRARTELASLRKASLAAIEYANGAQEGGVPGSPHAGVHDVRIHIRGRYDRLGEVVPRRFPEILAGPKQPPIKSGSGRRELAAWLTDVKNPLTARVMVNRLWQHHFGRGLVATPSNFGKLGERPTHPELLDWLAAEFIRSGWSIKAMHRLMVLSATYRQDSLAPAQALSHDPDNLLLGRMPRRRLEAEALRDAMLTVAGRLDRTPGGKATRDLNSPRRSLYLMTIRSDRSGFGPLFDVADSTAPTDRRVTSTVAPQALFLLNNDFSKRQAEALMRRVLAWSAEERERIVFAYQLLYSRPPLSEEIELASVYLARAGRTQEAWRDYCQVLLCANEFVYVE